MWDYHYMRTIINYCSLMHLFRCTICKYNHFKILLWHWYYLFSVEGVRIINSSDSPVVESLVFNSTCTDFNASYYYFLTWKYFCREENIRCRSNFLNSRHCNLNCKNSVVFRDLVLEFNAVKSFAFEAVFRYLHGSICSKYYNNL